MSATIKFTIDGREASARLGQTILEAAEENGVWIPRLCAHPELEPFGSCRVCTVKVNGRPQAACTQPVSHGMIVESESDEVRDVRKSIVEMLFVEGNHFCPFCEKSGDCELQALAYRLGIDTPRHPYLFPRREVDATHPDLFVDHNRCVLCARCVRASRDLDGKHAFGLVGRGMKKRVAPDSAGGLGSTEAAATDAAARLCPVGAILVKRTGYRVPVGQRTYDHEPIGSDVEKKSAGVEQESAGVEQEPAGVEQEPAVSGR